MIGEASELVLSEDDRRVTASAVEATAPSTSFPLLAS